MKFLCDEMLADLGRWLRAAGYDTLIAQKGKTDSDIYEDAVEGHRLLLTRDRHFLNSPFSDEVVVWLQGNDLEECVKLLKTRVHINWLHKPFSRCLVCNNLLIIAGEPEIKNVPQDILAKGGAIWHCPHCHQSFWEGSHTKHMLQKLSKWHSGDH